MNLGILASEHLVKDICNMTMKAEINIRRYNKRAKVIDQISSLRLVCILILGLALGFLATEGVRFWLLVGMTMVTIGRAYT